MVGWSGAHRLTNLERRRAGDAFGWGVVFSDQTLGNRRSARYIMLGTTCLFGAFTFIFVQNEHGVFRAH